MDTLGLIALLIVGLGALALIERWLGPAMENRRCPYCRKRLKRYAIVCHHCGREVTPPSEAAAREASSAPSYAPGGMATFYRVLSWIFSLVYSVGLVALTGIIANHFFSDHVTADAEFVAIAIVVGAWVWVWRRYGAPLLNLIPRREYQRFVRSRSGKERFRAPLFHHLPKPEYDQFVAWREKQSNK